MTIHVRWPVLCKVELEGTRDTLKRIADRIRYRGDLDPLVLNLDHILSTVKIAQEQLEEAYDDKKIE